MLVIFERIYVQMPNGEDSFGNCYLFRNYVVVIVEDVVAVT